MNISPERVSFDFVRSLGSDQSDDYNDHRNWEKELLDNIPSETPASRVEKVFFHKDFPVDVRHNAKIHRLALAKAFGGG